MKRSSLAPGRRRYPTPTRARALSQFNAGIYTARCAQCGDRGCTAHHIITQQKLDEVAPRYGLDPDVLVGDRRNRLPLCSFCHANHHARSRPVPWHVLEQDAPKVFQFANELGLAWWVEQTYPRAAA